MLIQSALALLFILAPMAASYAGELHLRHDPPSRAGSKNFAGLLNEFETLNPGYMVGVAELDSRDVADDIVNLLAGQAPDLMALHAGSRLASFMEAGLLEDVTDLWQGTAHRNWRKNAETYLTFDGRKWGIPLGITRWQVYYRKDLFAELGLAVPQSWNEFLEVCERLKQDGIAPLAIGTRSTWSTLAFFSYLNLRVNGRIFHKELTEGIVAFTDSRLEAVFDRWDDLVRRSYFVSNFARRDWLGALMALVRGRAAMVVTGDYAVPPLLEAGLSEETLGAFAFPRILPGLEPAELIQIDTLVVPARASNRDDARKLLDFVGNVAAEDAIHSQDSAIPTDPAVPSVESEQWILALPNEVPTKLADAAGEAFRAYMIDPDRRFEILKQLEETAAAHYGR